MDYHVDHYGTVERLLCDLDHGTTLPLDPLLNPNHRWETLHSPPKQPSLDLERVHDRCLSLPHDDFD